MILKLLTYPDAFACFLNQVRLEYTFSFCKQRVYKQVALKT